MGNLQRYSRKKINLKIERDLFRIIYYQIKMFKSLESDENDLPKFFSRLQDDRFDNIEKNIYLFSNRPIDAVCGSSMTRSLSSFQENKLFESVTKCTFRFVGLTSSFSILYTCLLIFTFWYKRVVFSHCLRDCYDFYQYSLSFG